MFLFLQALRLIGIGLVVYGVYLLGRALRRWVPKEGQRAESPPPPARSRPSGMAVDPVCQMPLLSRESTRHVRHEGQTYFFCSADCEQRFAKAPHRYANREPDAGTPDRPR